MFFQKCQRHFISLCKFLYFSTETTCPIFMDLRPLFLQMFDSGSKPWMVGLSAGWSRLREIRRDYVSVWVCVCECIRERNLYVCLCVRSCMRSFSGCWRRSALCSLLSDLISMEHVKRSTFPLPGRLLEKKKSNTPLVPSVPHQTNNLTPGHRLPLSFIERRFLKEEM